MNPILYLGLSMYIIYITLHSLQPCIEYRRSKMPVLLDLLLFVVIEF